MGNAASWYRSNSWDPGALSNVTSLARHLESRADDCLALSHTEQKKSRFLLGMMLLISSFLRFSFIGLVVY